jgi:glycosyltransferase involved in cell wall biosynthesis
MSFIDIVLASYNGEAYIEEQIRSIQVNTFYEHYVSRVIIVDDGSTDNSLSILQRLAYTDNKIQLYPSSSASLGCMKNFVRGLYLSDAQYVMFCDQDDVWLPEKIEKTFNLLISIESNDRPALAFTDLSVVDQNLHTISDSYFDLKSISKNWHCSFYNLIQQNVASGCTMMVNRALVARALPIPNSAYMHDWWFLLVAHQFGDVGFLNESTMLYRQHDSNVIGVRKKSMLHQVFHIRKYWKSFSKSVYSSLAQAKAFEERFSPELTEDTRTALTELAKVAEKGLSHKLNMLLSGRLSRNTLKARLVLFLVVLFGSRPS